LNVGIGKIRSGTVLVLGLAAIMAAGWFSYRAFVPPRWLHDLAGEIATRSAPDPKAPPPRDTREARPAATPDHPFICVARIVDFAWDRMVVVPSGADARQVPALRGVSWPADKAADYARRMAADPRYQLILFIKGEQVVADALFYTFWGDLSALARPDGFTPETAAFTAAVDGGTHRLAVAEPFPSVCKGTP
jgi:hypothetical protein